MLPGFWNTVVNVWISAWIKCHLTGYFPALNKVVLVSDLQQFRPAHVPNPFAMLTLTPVLPPR